MSAPKDIETVAPYFDGQKDYWFKTSSLMGGTKAMREAREAFLPKHEAESDTAYSVRVGQSFLSNAFRSTVRQITAQAFANGVSLDEDATGDLVTYQEDIDLEGSDLKRFSRFAFTTAVSRGEVYLVATMPEASEDERSKADQKASGRRPYLFMIRPDAMLDIRWHRGATGRVCTYMRWRDDYDALKDSGVGYEKVERIREWTSESWAVYEKRPGKTEFEETLKGENPFTAGGVAQVPVSAIYLSEEEEDGSRIPPLNDLADKNVEHWMSASDQRSILSYARYPMLWAAGVEDDELPRQPNTDKIAVGPKTFLRTSNSQGRFGILEPTGAGIKAGSDDLERIIEEMAILAAQPFMQRPGDETATRRALDQGQSNTLVQDMLDIYADGLELAIYHLGAWVNENWSVKVAIEPDWGGGVFDSTRITALINARRQGDLSRSSFIAELVALGVLSETFDAEANDKQLMLELGQSLEDEPANAPDEDENEDQGETS